MSAKKGDGLLEMLRAVESGAPCELASGVILQRGRPLRAPKPALPQSSLISEQTPKTKDP